MTEDSQAIWLERYRSTQSLERKLKEMLHQKGATGVTDARDRLREEYERLILTDIVLAQSKEIEQSLWKNVFYIVIDGYRRKLASLSQNEKSPQQNQHQNSSKQSRRNGGGGRNSNSNGNSNGQGGRGGDRKTSPSISMDYRKVSTKFRAFIQEATGFYHRLIQNLTSCYDLNEMGAVGHIQAITVGYRQTLEISDAARQAAISSCHKCYIFLGDLARYRQTYSDSPKKNWSAARDYYNEARNLLPTSGNPYNQLAVIATFAPNNFLSLYFYYRSLAVRLPFMTARKNIAVLIQKLSTDVEKGAKFTREGRPNDRNPVTKDSSQLNGFLSKFVATHGALFMRSAEELDQSLMQSSLERLFLDRQIDPELLLKIQIVNMSSLYTMCYIPAQEDGPSVSPEDQTTFERKALQLITNAFATILRHSTLELEQHRNTEQKASGRPADFLPSNVHRSMPTLRLSLKWLLVNIHHVKRLTEGLSDDEMERLKLDQIWHDLAILLTLLSDVYPYSNDTIFCRDILKEDAELQGFAALKRAIDERPLSIIPPNRISAKAEMQMRVADMFHDALVLSKLEWIKFYGRTQRLSDGSKRLMFSTDRDTLGMSDGESNKSRSEISGDDDDEDVQDEEDGNDDGDGKAYDREHDVYDANRKPSTSDRADHYRQGGRSTTVQKTVTEDHLLDQDKDQRQAVAALLSDDDNDLSLIVGGADDDDEEEEDERRRGQVGFGRDVEREDDDDEEEVVLFAGRNSSMSGKPTPRPAHLKTKTGVIGGGRRSSNSSPASNQSSPGVNEGEVSQQDDLRFVRSTSSPTVDSVFGGFQFGAADDWRHSINALRTSRTVDGSLSLGGGGAAIGTNPSNTWGGPSNPGLGNGLISTGTFETHRGARGTHGFGSMLPPMSPLTAGTSQSGLQDDAFYHGEGRAVGQEQQHEHSFGSYCQAFQQQPLINQGRQLQQQGQHLHQRQQPSQQQAQHQYQYQQQQEQHHYNTPLQQYGGQGNSNQAHSPRDFDWR
ncbi:hypothetical protein BGZ94_008035 [Podila epigama]|nr:hypothetical protein BGZ94_008035 [Podila epigama]